jgi:hypothetical protein
VQDLLKREGYQCVLVSAATRSQRPDQYPKMRDELWFLGAARARAGGVYLGRLDRRTLARLRQQLLAPEWELRDGVRVVEPKDETKKKIGRSPDDADSLNLSHFDGGGVIVGEPIPNPPRRPLPGPFNMNPESPNDAWGHDDPPRRRLYGRS